MNFKVLTDLEQGSQAWLDCRKSHITATEVAHLWSGKTSFESLRNLKLGITPPPDLSRVKSIQEGKLFEPMIRNYLVSNFKKLLCPLSGVMDTPCIESVEEPYFMASLDGISECIRNEYIPVEIKNTYSQSAEDSYDDVCMKGPNGKVGTGNGYYGQIQWQIFITGASKAIFCTHKSEDGINFCPKNFRTMIVKRDNSVIEELKTIAYGFKSFMETGVLPDITIGKRVISSHEDEVLRTLVDQYKSFDQIYNSVKQKLKELKEKRDELANQLVELLPDGCNKLEGSDFVIARIERLGQINTDELVKTIINKSLMKREEIEEFRKDSIFSTRISLK